MNRYFTIVLRADTDAGDFAARQLVPGERLGLNAIVGCALGNALTLNDRFKELIPSDKEEEIQRLEQADLAPHFARSQSQTSP